MISFPKVYYCEKCDRYTDVRYLYDRIKGERVKCSCYKCGNEFPLEPVEVSLKHNKIAESTKPNPDLQTLGKAAKDFPKDWIVVPVLDANNILVEKINEIKKLLSPCDSECEDCGVKDCPSHEPLHYHHDGCPACEALADDMADINREK